MTKQIPTGSNLPKRRGRSQESAELIARMAEICEEMEPITGRGVGYKLFSAGLIRSMSTNDMARVYRLLRLAREEGIIEWSWIVDETRELEIVSTWSNPEQFIRCALRSYRRDFWNEQPNRVEVWSEKGTIRGVLQPVLDKYGVGFRVMHGFGSATSAYDIAQDDDGRRDLIALYVGDYDPSGFYMSEVDLPERIQRYGGYHVDIRRIAITLEQATGLPSFPASLKYKDPRYEWFVLNYGEQCWELDAMDPRVQRDVVEQAILEEIELEAWNRCETVQAAERESMVEVMSAWTKKRRS